MNIYDHVRFAMRDGLLMPFLAYIEHNEIPLNDATYKDFWVRYIGEYLNIEDYLTEPGSKSRVYTLETPDKMGVYVYVSPESQHKIIGYIQVV